MHTSNLAYKHLPEWPAGTYEGLENVGLLVEQALLDVERGREFLFSIVYTSINPSTDNFIDLLALAGVSDVRNLANVVGGKREHGFEKWKGYSAHSKYRLCATGTSEAIPRSDAMSRFSTSVLDYATTREVLGLIVSNRSVMWGLMKRGYYLVALGNDIFNRGRGDSVIFFLNGEQICMDIMAYGCNALWESHYIPIVRV